MACPTWLSRYRAWRAHRALRRRARAALDELFRSRPELLARGRLAARHRARLLLLEVDADASGEPRAIRFGIVRHPRPHPLAPRGDEVVEVLEYRPDEPDLRVIAARNLARRPPRGRKEG